jgi:UDP-glucuronate decarboxylase
MKVLVTGGAGLIGSSLCEKLLEENEVICVDNFTSGLSENLQKCLTYRNFTLLDLDITKDILYIDVDQIYNLASPSSPNHFKSNSIETISSNTIGTMNVLNLALKQKIPVVHLSTVRVLENCNTFSDNSCYVEGKRCSETICYEYRKIGVDVKVVRLFNVYGKRMRKDDSRVIPQFIRNALLNEPLVIYGTGNQKDCFCYVDDITDILIDTIYKNITVPISIGTDEMITIKELANIIITETKSISSIQYIDVPDCDRAHFSMDYKIHSPIISGIRKIIEHKKNII